MSHGSASTAMLAFIEACVIGRGKEGTRIGWGNKDRADWVGAQQQQGRCKGVAHPKLLLGPYVSVREPRTKEQ
jgi:hypothetical protein